MGKRIVSIFFTIFVAMFLFVGCGNHSAQNNSSSSTPADEPVASSDSSSARSDAGSTLESSSKEEDVSSVSDSEEKTGGNAPAGELIYNDGALFALPENEKLGGEEQVEAWKAAIADRDSVARIAISTFSEARPLTSDESAAVLDMLQGLSPQVFEKMGNPSTGGFTYIIAYDSDGTKLWQVAFDGGSWMTVCIGDGTTPYILDIGDQPIDAIPTE